MGPSDLTALILCGGRGTRALPHTAEVPKPLLDVAGQPILRHLMDVFVAQGCRSFVLAGGYLVGALREYAATLPRSWKVEVADTGEDTGTGARVAACWPMVGEPAIVTYGDGLADIDLDALIGFHLSHGRAATVTAVPLQSPYGTLDVDQDGTVRAFREKPLLREHWINGGFFVFDRRAERLWAGDDLERDVLRPGQTPDRVMPEIIVRSLRGQPLRMTAGRQTREFNYVDDLATGLVTIATALGVDGEVFNLGSGHEVSMRELASTIVDLLGRPVEPDFGALPDRPNEIWRMVSDASKARERLGWDGGRPLRDGLAATIDWYRSSGRRRLSSPSTRQPLQGIS